MKKIKVLLGLLVVGFVALVIYQNREYFLTKQALSLSLGVETWNWTSPEIENVYYFGGCFIIGLIMTGYLGLCSKLKARKINKNLNATIVDNLQTIETLQTELDTFKSDPYYQKNGELSDELSGDDESETIELPENMDKAQV